MRFLTPLAFFLCALYVHSFNSRDQGSVLAFPFLEALWPGLAGDPQALGRASEGLLLLLGGLTLGVALVRAWMARRSPTTD